MNLPALLTSLQTANRHIQELQDTIHHWQIKYQQLYHRHFQLEQQQLWCNTCQSRFDLEKISNFAQIVLGVYKNSTTSILWPFHDTRKSLPHLGYSTTWRLMAPPLKKK